MTTALAAGQRIHVIAHLGTGRQTAVAIVDRQQTLENEMFQIGGRTRLKKDLRPRTIAEYAPQRTFGRALGIGRMEKIDLALLEFGLRDPIRYGSRAFLRFHSLRHEGLLDSYSIV